jgi:hypothetical protein
VQTSSLLSFDDVVHGCQWEVQTLSAGFCIGAHRRCRVIKEGFLPLGRGEYSYDIELYASTNVLSFEASSASLSYNL